MHACLASKPLVIEKCMYTFQRKQTAAPEPQLPGSWHDCQHRIVVKVVVTVHHFLALCCLESLAFCWRRIRSCFYSWVTWALLWSQCCQCINSCDAEFKHYLPMTFKWLHVKHKILYKGREIGPTWREKGRQGGFVTTILLGKVTPLVFNMQACFCFLTAVLRLQVWPRRWPA